MKTASFSFLKYLHVVVSLSKICYSFHGDATYKYLNLLAVFALVCFFTLSLVFPSLKNIMKICALGVYALVSFLYIKEKKKGGENIEKDVLFSACVVLLFGYLFFIG